MTESVCYLTALKLITLWHVFTSSGRHVHPVDIRAHYMPHLWRRGNEKAISRRSACMAWPTYNAGVSTPSVVWGLPTNCNWLELENNKRASYFIICTNNFYFPCCSRITCMFNSKSSQHQINLLMHYMNYKIKYAFCILEAFVNGAFTGKKCVLIKHLNV